MRIVISNSSVQTAAPKEEFVTLIQSVNAFRVMGEKSVTYTYLVQIIAQIQIKASVKLMVFANVLMDLMEKLANIVKEIRKAWRFNVLMNAPREGNAMLRQEFVFARY